MTPQSQLGIIWALAAILMSLGWMWQRARTNAGIVDVLWASGLSSSAVLLALTGSGAGDPRVLLALLGGAWGARLAAHLWKRVSGEAEDGRYQALRARWRGNQLKFFFFFQFQAFLIAMFSVPFLAVAANARPEAPWLIAGTVIWAVSVAGETIADRQLTRFRADPANKRRTCRRGLWAYSRHPNYFFEWLHWISYVCFAVGSPLAGLAYFGPLVMYVFLRWVSGIPYTESQALRTRGEDYREYQRSVPMLFPRFPPRSAK